MPKPFPGQSLRRRADSVLVERGFAESRARARAAIEAGGVSADGQPLVRASDLIFPEAEIAYAPAFAEVSRAAAKLKAAPGFAEARLDGLVVLDVGASTGGFTEVCVCARRRTGGSSPSRVVRGREDTRRVTHTRVGCRT